MQAMVYTQYGGPDVLRQLDVPKPAPKENQILIRVHACALNDWDLGLLKGDFVNRCINGFLRPKKYSVIGSDIAGIVEEIGAEVKTLKPGDRVFGDLCEQGFGGLAEYVCVNEGGVALMPKAMSFIQAATIPQSGVLATQALIDAGKVKPGQKVLINGAGGAAGTLAIQFLKDMDVEVTGVDSRIKLGKMRELGFDHVIDYIQEDFTANDKRYDLIVDAKTNRSPFRYLKVLAPKGIYVTIGGQILRLAQFALLAPLINKFSSKQLKIVTLKPNKDLAFYNNLFEAGKLQPFIDGPYPLEQVSAAFERYLQNSQIGKIVITVRDEIT